MQGEGENETVIGIVDDCSTEHNHESSKVSDNHDYDDYEEYYDDEESPIEEVRMTVPTTDNPALPALTFRTWVLGLTFCCILSFVNKFSGYRNNQLMLSSLSAQIVVLPLGKLMAATLPSKPFKIPLTGWSFTMNPGPFNVKEHVLITVFANSGANGVYAIYIITSIKAFYHREVHIVAGFLLALTTQMLGYGFAGLFRKYLVDSPYMWWPSNLVQVSLFRVLHDKEKRPKGGKTRLQFFLLVFVASFSYYIIPAYFFPAISAVSVACLIWKDSITIQQIGSGLHGLGIGSFSFDWATVSGFLGSPLAFPAFAIVNTLIGFTLSVYVALPLMYWWGNVYDAQKFPIISPSTFDNTGKHYNVTRILNRETFSLNHEAYHHYSKLHMSTFFVLIYGLSFGTTAATVSHVALFHGRMVWKMWKKTGEVLKNQDGDVHTRLMKQNYSEVPYWWFCAILVTVTGLAIYTCEGFDNQLQLQWWGVLLAGAIGLFFTFPFGIIKATTNMELKLNVILEYIIGYLDPGKPLANVVFKTYGYMSMSQALGLLGDLKLGHYMKIPPKLMFLVQAVGTLVSSTVYYATAWWLLTTVNNICDPGKLPTGSPWTCPGDDVFYNASIIWGVVGPMHMFTELGNYPEMNWFFLFGFLAPVPIWASTKLFPKKKWLAYINVPVILGATQLMPPARSVNYTSWISVGLFFNVFIFNKYKKWWARHNYILSAGLDAGIIFLSVLLYLALQSKDIIGPRWWGLKSCDRCLLAKCASAPGIHVEGCPVF